MQPTELIGNLSFFLNDLNGLSGKYAWDILVKHGTNVVLKFENGKGE